MDYFEADFSTTDCRRLTQSTMCESPDKTIFNENNQFLREINYLKSTITLLKTEMTDLKDDKIISDMKVKE